LITASKLITKLYRGIGNGKVDIFERESGKKHINDLLQKGFSLEDIDFAIEWGLENARGEIEDFSSVKNLMDRAIAAREEHMAKRAQQAEREVERQEEEEIERKMVEAYRKMMPDADKKRLRDRVMGEIRQDKRINEEFVTETYIIIKENEIIRKEYLRRGIENGG
jgi:DNA-binding transcriptional MerR regulator